MRGHSAVRELQPLLVELAASTGQAGVMDDLAYFLTTPDAVKKTPTLILQRPRRGADAVRGFASAALFFEYRIAGWGTRVFAASDSTGRRNVLAAPETRPRVVAEAARTLLSRGAQIVHIGFESQLQDPACSSCAADRARLEPAPDNGLRSEDAVAAALAQRPGDPSWLWNLTEHTIPLFLPLESSFAATLARIGPRTRYNLKYYRRRTERDLGCSFVPEVKIGLDEFLAFNRECMFAVPEEHAAWRYESLGRVMEPLLCGVRDRNGRWLSLLGGRRREAETDLDWQMNRDGLAVYSLSTAARCYLIEHEVARGSRRLYMEGGTPHPMRRSFAEAGVGELTMKRRSLYVALLTRFAGRIFPPKNHVSQLLRNPDLTWRV